MFSSRIRAGFHREELFSKFLLVFTTVPDKEATAKIARILVEDRLAACVSHLSDCHSSYWWEGKITQEREHMLLIKTPASRYRDLEEKLVAIHPYEVPEVIAIHIKKGYGRYPG
jgi:periplasmic divalent cation tolerance protein